MLCEILAEQEQHPIPSQLQPCSNFKAHQQESYSETYSQTCSFSKGGSELNER